MKSAVGKQKCDIKVLRRERDRALLWLLAAVFCVTAYVRVFVWPSVSEGERREMGTVSCGMVSSGVAEEFKELCTGKPGWTVWTIPGALGSVGEVDATLKKSPEEAKPEQISENSKPAAAALFAEEAPVEKVTAAGAPVEETLTAEIPVVLHGNGGLPETSELTVRADDFDIEGLAEPVRPGKLFDGWYLDAGCTIPFTGTEEAASGIELYAGWEEFPGYCCDDAGFVSGYSDAGLVLTDGLVALPSYDSCVGLRADAFTGIEEEIFEVYVPANITEIEENVFTRLPNLLFIEVAGGNSSYYSVDGVLYHSDGSLAAMPAGR